MLAVELPTGGPTNLSPPSSPQHVTLELCKNARGRCGLSLVQSREALAVSAVAPGSIAAEAGFAVGDVLLNIGGVPTKDLRFSKIKANGLLFDARGTCSVVVQRGAEDSAAAAAVVVAAAAPPADPVQSIKAMLKEERQSSMSALSTTTTASTSSSLPSSSRTAAAAAAHEAAAARAAYETAKAADAAREAEDARKVSEARAAAEAKVAAAMARAAEEARAAAAARAKAEREAAEAAQAAAKAKAAERAAARLKEQAEEEEKRQTAAAAAASSSSASTLPSDTKPATSEAAAAPAAKAGGSAARVFARGETVLHDNPRTGAMEMCVIAAVHLEDPTGPYYTITVNGQERQTEASRLRACAHQPAVPTRPAGSVLPEIPAFRSASVKRPRIGAGNPHAGRVPGLPLAASGIGVAPPMKKAPALAPKQAGAQLFGAKAFSSKAAWATAMWPGPKMDYK